METKKAKILVGARVTAMRMVVGVAAGGVSQSASSAQTAGRPYGHLYLALLLKTP